MSRTSRTIGAAVVCVVFTGKGSTETSETTQASIPHAAPPPQAHREPRLGLSHRGQPIVWLRHGARIPIRAAPGGKIVKTLGSQTPFDSRTVLAVFGQHDAW